MDEILQRVVDHHNAIMMAKAAAVTFLADNHKALGIPEPCFSEVEYYLNVVARQHGLEEVVATGSKQST